MRAHKTILCGLIAIHSMSTKSIIWGQTTRNDDRAAIEVRPTHGWKQFRGDHRDGSAVGVPKSRLVLKKEWEFPLPSDGVGGIAASEDLVVVSSRDAKDASDCFYILDPVTGSMIHQMRYEAPGKLDYGNSPRATPVIGDELVYTLGAFGNLLAIDPIEGTTRWQTHLENDLGGRMPAWGYCASPLLVDDRLIVQPGGVRSSIVALDAQTGKILWKAIGNSLAGYASPMLLRGDGTLKTRNVLGCLESGLACWSLFSGEMQWHIRPDEAKEFMVPSPLIVDQRIYWLGETNGLRSYQCDSNSPKALPKLLSQNPDVAHDTHSPTWIDGYIVAFEGDLLVLDPKNGLAVVDAFQHPSLDGYCSIIKQDNRALVCCSDGTLLLLTLNGGKWKLEDSLRPLKNDAAVLAQAALSKGQLYLRSHRSLQCYSVSQD